MTLDDPRGGGSAGATSAWGVADPAGPQRPTHPAWRPGAPPSAGALPEIGEAHRTGPGDPPRLGPLELLVAAAVYLGTSVGFGVLVAVATPGGAGGVLLLAGAAVAAFLAVAVALLVRVRDLAAVGVCRVGVRWLLVALGIGVGAWVLSRVAIVVYVGVTGDLRNSQQEITDLATGSLAQLSALLVMAVLVAPVGEELLFRGIVYGSLRRYGTVVASLVSAIVFSLAHGLGAVTLAVFVLAVANAVLYERSRSIWPCVLAHGTFNLISLGLAVLLLR